VSDQIRGKISVKFRLSFYGRHTAPIPAHSILSNFNQFVCHTSQGLWRNEIWSISRVPGLYDDGLMSQSPKYSNFACSGAQSDEICSCHSRQRRWRNKNFVRRVTSHIGVTNWSKLDSIIERYDITRVSCERNTWLEWWTLATYRRYRIYACAVLFIRFSSVPHQLMRNMMRTHPHSVISTQDLILEDCY